MLQEYCGLQCSRKSPGTQQLGFQVFQAAYVFVQSATTTCREAADVQAIKPT